MSRVYSPFSPGFVDQNGIQVVAHAAEGDFAAVWSEKVQKRVDRRTQAVAVKLRRQPFAVFERKLVKIGVAALFEPPVHNRRQLPDLLGRITLVVCGILGDFRKFSNHEGFGLARALLVEKAHQERANFRGVGDFHLQTALFFGANHVYARIFAPNLHWPGFERPKCLSFEFRANLPAGGPNSFQNRRRRVNCARQQRQNRQTPENPAHTNNSLISRPLFTNCTGRPTGV